MKREHNIPDLTEWLKKQIEYANRIIAEARDSQNYGRETHYSGMKEAFMKCLSRLPAVGNGTLS